MISVVDRYFSLNRTLLLTVGLWPYQKTKLARLYTICIFSIIITAIIFQLTAFLTLKCDMDLSIKILSFTCASISVAIKYNSFCVNTETMKYLMEELQRTYNDIKINNEIAIIERYANYARCYTSVLAMMFCVGMVVFMIAQLLPNFLHSILSINQSQPQGLQITTEYFVDEEKYFYLLLLHMTAAICVGMFAVLATGAMLISYLLHACGMFKIASCGAISKTYLAEQYTYRETNNIEYF